MNHYCVCVDYVLNYKYFLALLQVCPYLLDFMVRSYSTLQLIMLLIVRTLCKNQDIAVMFICLLVL